MLDPGIQRWLQHHCDGSPDVTGGVVITYGNGQGTADMVAEWPTSNGSTPALASAAQAAVQRDQPVILAPAVRLADADHNRVISLPLRSGSRLSGAVALAVRADDAAGVRRLLDELSRASNGVGQRLSPDSDRDPATVAARVLQIQALLLAQSTLAEGALAMVTELATVVGSERVTLGVMNPDMRDRRHFRQRRFQIGAVAASAFSGSDAGGRRPGRPRQLPRAPDGPGETHPGPCRSARALWPRLC